MIRPESDAGRSIPSARPEGSRRAPGSTRSPEAPGSTGSPEAPGSTRSPEAPGPARGPRSAASCARWGRGLRLVAVAVLALIGLASGPAGAEEIPLTREGGVYNVPVTLNGATQVPFVIDTGAAMVMIPADVYQQLVDAGTVHPSDVLSPMIMVTADGSRHKVPRFYLASLRVGSKQLTSVAAAVGPAGTSPLLGQSFLERVGTWRLDAQRQRLVLEEIEPLRIDRFTFGSSKSGPARETPQKGEPLFARFVLVGATRQGDRLALRGQYRVESEAGRVLAEKTLADMERPWQVNDPFPIWLRLSAKAPAGRYWVTVRIEDRTSGKAAVYRSRLLIR